MSKRLCLTASLFVVACASQAPAPAPVTEPTPDPALTEDNQRLRAEVSELEGRLARVTEARDSAVAMNIEVSTALDKAQAELKNAHKKARPPTRPVDGVRYSIPLNDGIIDGRNNAMVTIVVATEAACPFCWRAEDTLSQLRDDYKKDLRIVYQTRIVHPVATAPARAFCAANKQKKGMKMWKAIRGQWDLYRSRKNRKAFDRAELVAIAKKLRIKTKRFEKDMDGDCKELVEKQNRFFTKMGVNGTPTFFINGKVLNGAQPPERFKAIIDAELDAAREMVAAGLDKRSIYAAIVAFGKKGL